MKVKLFLISVLVWGSALAVALLAQVNMPIESPVALVNKQTESPLARSQRCVGSECGLVPSDFASREP
jgi:hypothetical protein